MATIYPSAIARACSILDESPLFKDLPDTYLRVVIRIIKKISLNCLKKPIVASRATLSLESGKSVETVGRVVKWLEERGLIERTQRPRAGLRGSSSPITPTEKLLEVLTLRIAVTEQAKPVEDAPPPVDNSISVKPVPPRTGGQSHVQSDGSISTRQEQSKENQPGHFVPKASSVDKNGQQKNTRAFETDRGPVFIPMDLSWMVEKAGLRATAVLKLMQYARGQQKRLSDVVQVTRKYLENLKDKSLFAYLHKLLKEDRDFSAVAHKEQKTHQEEQEKARLEQKAIELEGRSFKSRDGKLRINVRANGRLEFIRAGVMMGSSPMLKNPDFLRAIDEGRLMVCVNEG